jgi:hypothetical protein
MLSRGKVWWSEVVCGERECLCVCVGGGGGAMGVGAACMRTQIACARRSGSRSEHVGSGCMCTRAPELVCARVRWFELFAWGVDVVVCDRCPATHLVRDQLEQFAGLCCSEEANGSAFHRHKSRCEAIHCSVL